MGGVTRYLTLPSSLGDIISPPLPPCLFLHSPPDSGGGPAVPTRESMTKDTAQHPTIPTIPWHHKPRTLAGRIRLGEPGLCCQSEAFRRGGRERSLSVKKTPSAMKTTGHPSESENTSQSSWLHYSAGEGTPEGKNTGQGQRAG